jgi:hypothetical protein
MAMHHEEEQMCGIARTDLRSSSNTPSSPCQGGGGNPFDMKNLMESVKKAQQLVQVETARVQQELAK